MTQETIADTSESSPPKSSSQQSSSLPDVFSHALMHLVDSVQPSIVQVLNEGRGAGTGIIWETDGHSGSIITNHHVVPEGSTAIKVHLADGQILDARVVDRNAKLDLAMLSISAEQLQPVTAGDSARLRVGEWVFAVGNPWGQRGVVTAGIVSSVNNTNNANNASTTKASTAKNEVEMRYIKSDVVLAPGNSGGPLLDADGRVVGVNAMVFGGDLAVSIPSNIVSAWIAGLPRRRVTLGIEVQPVDLLDLAQAIQAQVGGSAKRKKAVLIVGFGEDTDDARRTGVRADAGVFIGDVLLEVAGKPVVDETSLVNILVRKEPEEKIALRLVRGGAVHSIEVQVASLEQQA